jgi:esterase/lipase
MSNTYPEAEGEPFLWQAGQPAAVFVHGYPGTPAEIRPLAEELHAAGWTVQGVLLPGFGAQIATLPERTYREWIDCVLTAVRDLKRTHAHVFLIGYSMGGAISINVAAEEALAGLILFAPFWKLETFLFRMLPVWRTFFSDIRLFRLLRPNIAKPSVRAGIADFMPHVDLDDPQVQAHLSDLKLPIKLFDQLRLVGVRGYRLAPTITTPTLVVQGKLDETVLPKLTRRLANRFGGALRYLEVNEGHDLVLPDLNRTATTRQTIREAVMRFSESVMTL